MEGDNSPMSCLILVLIVNFSAGCKKTPSTTTPSPPTYTTTEVSCSNNATMVSEAPLIPGSTSRMVLCDDPTDQTCEKDMEKLCPAGWHLCTYLEFNYLNDLWSYKIDTSRRPVGEIYCRRKTSEAGHFTVYGSGDILLSDDQSFNC